jgi:GNAT superfamily N-acetyltransferase
VTYIAGDEFEFAAQAADTLGMGPVTMSDTKDVAASIRLAATEDYHGISTLLGDALIEEPSAQYLFPSPVHRGSGLTRLFSSQLDRWTDRRIDVAEIDGEIVGTAIWSPPGAPETTSEALIPAKSGGVAAAVESALESIKPRLMRMSTREALERPSVPHWYLHHVAVSPAHQGRGIGTALMRSGTARIDQLGDNAYLEDTVLSRISWFEKHGFQPMPLRTMGWWGPPIQPMYRPGAL